jgi:hypothetical protein
MQVILLHPQAEPEHLGFIPDMLDEDDPRPAREQFDDNYAHGGGWRPQPKFTMDDDARAVLSFPGDPPLEPIAVMLFHDEIIFFYPHAIVAIVQRDGTFEACRMD